MRLYFAYGSNMSVAQMRKRCPAAIPVGVGWLADWRFIINQRGTASIVPSNGSAVQGVLWRTTRECIATLDVHEGVAKRRYRKLFVQVKCGSGQLIALTYAGLHRGEGRPIRSYLEGTILPAARDWCLQSSYREELAGWMGAGLYGPLKRRPRAKSWRP